jgi:glucose-6-phosphate 1-dehydrogenase
VTALTPDDHVIVLFGATGDLARRKLLPGLFRLAQAGLTPERYRIVGTSRAALNDDAFRRFARAALDEFGGPSPNGAWDAFAPNLSTRTRTRRRRRSPPRSTGPSASSVALRGACTTSRSRPPPAAASSGR